MTNESFSRPHGGPAPLSSGVRMIVSFLIIVHITAVVVCVAARANNTAAERIRRQIFAPYTQSLFMDQHYRFSHTLGDEGDVGYVLKSTVELRNGTTRELVLNDYDGSTGLRRQRWYRIATLIADNAQDEDAQSLLAQSIAQGLITLWGEEGVPADQIAKMTIEQRAHLLLSQFQVARNIDPNSPQQFTTVYAADVVLNPNGPPIVNRRSAAGEVAPAAAGAPATSASTSAPATKN